MELKVLWKKVREIKSPWFQYDFVQKSPRKKVFLEFTTMEKKGLDIKNISGFIEYTDT